MIHNAVTQFADSSSGLGALGFDGKAFLIQLITFVLAFLVLRRYAFTPIIKVLRERRELIESGVKLGEEMRTERSKLDDTIAQTLRETRKEADSIIGGAQDEARDILRKSEDKARVKAAEILKEADARIEHETLRSRKKLERDLVGLISEATEAIIDEKVDAKKDAELLERALKGRQAA